MVHKGVIIVGGGIMGVSAAYWLALKGRQVTLFDQSEVPNHWGASGDHLRAFRLTYGKDAFYTDLAAKTLPLWTAISHDSGEKLFVQHGVLEFAAKAKGYEEQSFSVLKDLKIPVHKLEKREIKKRYPMVDTRSVQFGLFHKDGGLLWATRATAAISTMAQRKGAKVRPHVKITAILKDKNGIKGVKDSTGRVWQAETYLFAVGAWTGQLLKNYRIPVQVTRQQQLYLRPPTNRGRYRPEHFPVWGAISKGFYGFPMHIHGFLKIAEHAKGAKGFPTGSAETDVKPQFVSKCRAFLKKIIPDLADFTEFEGNICYYTSTKDNDFIVDRLPDAPNGYVATGFSGHGFKFGPLIGRVLADMMTGEKPEINLHRFRLNRFRR